MQIVILAGGLGTRLKPITDTIPKPMALVGKEPFLLLLINQFKKNNFKKILLLTGYKSDIIKDFFKDGSQFGVDIEYSVEETPLGTGGSLKNAEKLLEKNFLLLNGDTFIDLNYYDFIEYAKNKKNSLITIVAYVGPETNECKYNMRINSDEKITSYSKNETDKNLNAVDAGVYFINKKILEKIPKTKFSLEIQLFPELIQKENLFAYKTNKNFYDIGTLERLKNFNDYTKL